MRRGFTILEVLVASLLLGMLVTVLTMIFNQSSIAWRTGVAGVADLDDVRQNMGRVFEEADNVYLWNGEMHRHVSLWDENGSPRLRSIDDGTDVADETMYLESNASYLENQNLRLSEIGLVNVGSGDSGSRSIKTYTVNVMSAGPDREFDTWDDIWSFPDDLDE